MDYTDAQNASDKLQHEQDVLHRMSREFDSPDAVRLLLMQAKRVRTASNLVVRELARLRDQLQP